VDSTSLMARLRFLRLFAIFTMMRKIFLLPRFCFVSSSIYRLRQHETIERSSLTIRTAAAERKVNVNSGTLGKRPDVTGNRLVACAALRASGLPVQILGFCKFED
jgi:hypothetical protein